MMSTIYAIIHREQGLIYVGQTGIPLRMRWSRHKHTARDPKFTSKVARALRADLDSYECVVIATVPRTEASDAERDFAHALGAFGRKGLNERRTYAGSWKHSDSARLKMSRSHV